MSSAQADTHLKAAQNMARAFEIGAAGKQNEAMDILCQFWRAYGMIPQAVGQAVQFGLSMNQSQLLLDSMLHCIKENPQQIVLRGKVAGLYLGLSQHEAALPFLLGLRNNECSGDKTVHRLVIDCYHAMHRLEDEIEACRHTQQRLPQEQYAYVSEGLALVGLGRHEESYAAHCRALEVFPDSPNLHVSRGVLQFMLTDFADGFEDYEYRHRQHNAVKIDFDVPSWNGESLEGKKLLIYQEQGIGDVIMWATLLPYMMTQTEQITLALIAKLQPLFARSFPEITIIDYDPDELLETQQQFDVVTPIADLMRYALPHERPSSKAAVFKANESKVEALRTHYLEVAQARGAQKLVGISWHTTNDRTGAYRNIPLEQWAPILSQPHIQCVSMQYGDHEDELKAIDARFPGAIYADSNVNAYHDTDGLAAQAAAMDEIVTIQNATSHIGGALGVPTSVMLSVASSWRFGLGHTHNAWYQSLQIERQETIFDWHPVIERIAKRLENEA